jgi:creatinine amidohydrolase/Fe(II)-dependent formamide hydrolase-like protein
LRETETGVMGDGTVATAEKGRAFVEEAAANLVDVVRWFRATERRARGWPTPTETLSW